MSGQCHCVFSLRLRHIAGALPPYSREQSQTIIESSAFSISTSIGSSCPWRLIDLPNGDSRGRTARCIQCPRLNVLFIYINILLFIYLITYSFILLSIFLLIIYLFNLLKIDKRNNLTNNIYKAISKNGSYIQAPSTCRIEFASIQSTQGCNTLRLTYAHSHRGSAFNFLLNWALFIISYLTYFFKPFYQYNYLFINQNTYFLI